MGKKLHCRIVNWAKPSFCKYLNYSHVVKSAIDACKPVAGIITQRAPVDPNNGIRDACTTDIFEHFQPLITTWFHLSPPASACVHLRPSSVFCDLSVSYLISPKHMLFENIAHDGSFQHLILCRFLFVPGCPWLCLGLFQISIVVLNVQIYLSYKWMDGIGWMENFHWKSLNGSLLRAPMQC